MSEEGRIGAGEWDVTAVEEEDDAVVEVRAVLPLEETASETELGTEEGGIGPPGRCKLLGWYGPEPGGVGNSCGGGTPPGCANGWLPSTGGTCTPPGWDVGGTGDEFGPAPSNVGISPGFTICPGWPGGGGPCGGGYDPAPCGGSEGGGPPDWGEAILLLCRGVAWELLLLPWLSWLGVMAWRPEADTSSGLDASFAPGPPLLLDELLFSRLSAEKLLFLSEVGVSLATEEGGYFIGPMASGGRYFRSCGCDCGCPGRPPASGWCGWWCWPGGPAPNGGIPGGPYLTAAIGSYLNVCS